VTVFPDRAGITRRAALDLPEGAHAVEIGPLPSGVEPDSVSAKGAGKAEVVLYGARLVTRQLETAQDPAVKALEEQIRAATGQQQRLRNTQAVLEQEREYLGSIRAASSEQIGKDLVTKSPNAGEAAALLAFLDEAFLKNFERDRQAAEELEALERELDRLRRELAGLTHGRYRQETLLVVDLDVRDDGPFALEVSYRVPGAAWSPSYEARASSSSDTIELVSSALVRQQTGEDWPDVQLTLSTAKPALAGSMPELAPWFLRPWEAAPMASKMALMAARAPAAPAEEPYQAQDGLAAGRLEEGKDEREAEVAFAAAAAHGPSVTFRLPKPISIPADWQLHKVPIGSHAFTAGLAYETTPKLLPYAFLRAKVTNTSEALLLAGPVSVFLDGAFVATASLKQAAPSEEFDLYLGADERVRVERTPLKERVEVSLLPGLRGKMKSTDYEFLTTIENFTGRTISVTAFDQLPVSEREEIIVESVQQAPAEVTKDPEKPGVFSWALSLVPNQKQELRLSYRIRHPVEMQLQ
jgi:uncharacterized protein (TIGR02231 family)